jgi:hypothetical protein
MEAEPRKAKSPKRKCRRFQFRLRRPNLTRLCSTLSMCLTMGAAFLLFGCVEFGVMDAVGVPMVSVSSLIIVTGVGLTVLAGGMRLRRGRMPP